MLDIVFKYNYIDLLIQYWTRSLTVNSAVFTYFAYPCFLIWLYRLCRLYLGSPIWDRELSVVLLTVPGLVLQLPALLGIYYLQCSAHRLKVRFQSFKGLLYFWFTCENGHRSSGHKFRRDHSDLSGTILSSTGNSLQPSTVLTWIGMKPKTGNRL